MEITRDSDDLLRIFHNTFRIPAGVFDKELILHKLYFDGGRRLLGMYLKDSASVLQGQKRSTGAMLLYDPGGSCWCIIPFGDMKILLGPVQTGRNPLFPYEGVPEYTWNAFRDLSRYVCSVLSGENTDLIENEGSYAEAYAARKMYIRENPEERLRSFDDLFLCVATGDVTHLNELIRSGDFVSYLDQIMTDMKDARTVFQFNLAKTYHSAQQSGASLDDLVPLVALYLSESARYRSLAAYKAGMTRMLYDFTRYVSQLRDERYSPTVSRAVMYIRDNIYKQISLEEIASHCMVSLSCLQHRFKQETGMTVKEKIRSSKIARARFFLRNTDLPCADIAYKMGYSSQSYFIKQFKKTAGVTPAEYRHGGGGV